MVCFFSHGIRFLSTPSARRATDHHGRVHRRSDISIHALREEGDDKVIQNILDPNTFLSTPSARRATPVIKQYFGANAFLSTPSARRATNAFSSPWTPWEFLSTPSARRATYYNGRKVIPITISIHALREEGDSAPMCRSRPCAPISIHALREEGD